MNKRGEEAESNMYTNRMTKEMTERVKQKVLMKIATTWKRKNSIHQRGYILLLGKDMEKRT